MTVEDEPYDGGGLHAALVINVAKWWLSQEQPSAVPTVKAEKIAAKAGEVVAGFGSASDALRAPLIATDAEALLEERAGTPDFDWCQWSVRHGNHE